MTSMATPSAMPFTRTRLREGRVQFADSYVLLKDGEAYLFGCQINPLPAASTHDPKALGAQPVSTGSPQ